MANLKSSKKDIRRTRRRTARNLNRRSGLESAVRAVRAATTIEVAKPALAAAFSALDRAAHKDLIHQRTASREKSRLAAFVATKFKKA
jgi:small subunit ribosomal protein S20